MKVYLYYSSSFSKDEQAFGSRLIWLAGGLMWGSVVPMVSRAFSWLVIWVCVALVDPGVRAEDRIEVIGRIDGTAQIVITHEGATWRHLFGDLAATTASVNGVLWEPWLNERLENSGGTVFLPNVVNFAAARLEVIGARDTVVLTRETGGLILSFGDTPDGPGDYHVVIHFPQVPMLQVEAEIDGSDELHISNSGARWLHNQWSPATGVSLNGVAWNPSFTDWLPNAGESRFLPEPVHFEGATVVEQSGRDLMTVRADRDGLIINFVDNPGGAGLYSARIAFPPPAGESLNASVPVVSSASMAVLPAAAISILTEDGLWYELEATDDLSGNVWVSTGRFVRGNGQAITIFDEPGATATRFYRVVCRARP